MIDNLCFISHPHCKQTWGPKQKFPSLKGRLYRTKHEWKCLICSQTSHAWCLICRNPSSFLPIERHLDWLFWTARTRWRVRMPSKMYQRELKSYSLFILSVLPNCMLPSKLLLKQVARWHLWLRFYLCRATKGHQGPNPMPSSEKSATAVFYLSFS